MVTRVVISKVGGKAMHWHVDDDIGEQLVGKFEIRFGMDGRTWQTPRKRTTMTTTVEGGIIIIY